ncbi:hypothetical protein GGTG_13001 [Gaeumannomyces tritici R3-111a-1]|uniref:Uncharacterized protein n=1 Tax=Gaeumannomyces tritici (strain R3-111a-1) TaxID=644352 RepID=J3PHM1_GAET3|nr:hypothetical protein GGTG_13001 [Gaeumannomyces tritici R3-111a-1]EJT69382.1 hypothetical protein GGTG_13001 [Gaeumannomyces tritici R3-111a-1]
MSEVYAAKEQLGTSAPLRDLAVYGLRHRGTATPARVHHFLQLRPAKRSTALHRSRASRASTLPYEVATVADRLGIALRNTPQPPPGTRPTIFS